MKKYTSKQLTFMGAVAAVYAILGYFSGVFGLAFGPVQCRFSEALCVLPFIFPEAAPGLFIGCIVTNLMSAYGPLDIVFGSIATLIAAKCTARAKNRWTATLPPVIANAIIVGAVISYLEAGFNPGFWPVFLYNALTIGAGQILACCVLGSLLLSAMGRLSFFRSIMPEEKLKIFKKK